MIRRAGREGMHWFVGGEAANITTPVQVGGGTNWYSAPAHGHVYCRWCGVSAYLAQANPDPCPAWKNTRNTLPKSQTVPAERAGLLTDEQVQVLFRAVQRDLERNIEAGRARELEQRLQKVETAALGAFVRWWIWAMDLDGPGQANKEAFVERFREECAKPMAEEDTE